MTPQYFLAEIATADQVEVTVAQVDLMQALHELVPSVSQNEMDHYKQVQQKFASASITAQKDKGKGKAVNGH